MPQILVKEIRNEVHLRLIKESIPRIIQCLHELSLENVWKRPNENSNAIGSLVLHLCGNVRQYLMSSIGGVKDDRNRIIEFEAGRIIER